MLQKDVKIGAIYVATISGKRVPIRIDAETERRTSYGIDYLSGRPRGQTRKGWDATNLKTGRRISIRSAAKLTDNPALAQALMK